MSRKCPTCEKTVYMGEKKESLGNWYHPLCLKCKKCGRQLAKGSHAEMPIIKLKSSDEEILDVDEEVAKTMLQGLGIEDFDDEPLPLPNVSGAILKKVIQWAEKHKDDPPLPDDDENKEKRTDDIDPWDQEFLKVDLGTFSELIRAANYLDLKGLIDVTCKTLANMIKGKTPEEIRKTFNIKNDFTPEEEEQVRKEDEWCEGK